MRCVECGNESLHPVAVDQGFVSECALCGHVDGPGELVERVLDVREARERGFDPLVYPLVKVLAELPGIRVTAAMAGDPEHGFSPAVQFEIADRRFDSLVKLLVSLTMINREARGRWVVEAELQRDLCFVLKPRLSPRFDDEWKARIPAFQEDLALLARRMRQNTSLSWWNKGS
ncbi:MAG: hypothetical protein HY719_01325 [Planctomycetes bacterium]|nr:hypothetical protein [Planctomycetota bacterium]